MDRSQARARVLGATALLLLCGAATPRHLPIREARWLQTPDIVEDLTRQPAECLSLPAGEQARRSVELGRIVFRSPLLLGGQAARAGLSCASCHRNGRSNPHFRFPGISGEPGTADVTASLMSKRRGDGTFNPRPIPDLGGDPARLKVKGTNELRSFIRGLVVEEFDGPEPPPPVLDGLTAYVLALSPNSCSNLAHSPVTLNAMLTDVETAVRLARDVYANGDVPTARVLLAAARSTLGAIDERFQVPGLEANRELLRAADAELRQLQNREGVSRALFDRWFAAWPQRSERLRSAEPRSLFSEAVLRRAVRGEAR